MSNRHEKFRKYWESLGKPALEACDPDILNWTKIDSDVIPKWHDGMAYRLAGDPHWKLRKEWVDSGFTLPIEHFIPSDEYGDDRWIFIQNIPSWAPEKQYRKAEFAEEVPLDLQSELGVNHPMYPIFMDAIEQATGGKGQRHGGARTPFLEQRWHRISQSTGFRSLVYQMCKKAEEACDKDEYEAFERELLGALVYGAMSLIHVRKHGFTKEVKADE